jgi:hypothetical protein
MNTIMPPLSSATVTIFLDFSRLFKRTMPTNFFHLLYLLLSVTGYFLDAHFFTSGRNSQREVAQPI